MADYCQQCSIDQFDQDFRELAGITSVAAWEQDKACAVICEGCGFIQVDPEGRCVTEDCSLHGLGRVRGVRGVPNDQRKS